MTGLASEKKSLHSSGIGRSGWPKGRRSIYRGTAAPRALGLFVVVAGLVAFSPPAAANWLQDLFAGQLPQHATKPPQERVPACDDPAVTRKIQRGVRRADPDYYRGIDAIERIDRIRQSAFIVDRPSPVARRYCRGRSHLSNGRRHTVYFLIEEDMGLPGSAGTLISACPGSIAGMFMMAGAGRCGLDLSDCLIQNTIHWQWEAVRRCRSVFYPLFPSC